jgi:hypothetical protein
MHLLDRITNLLIVIPEYHGRLGAKAVIPVESAPSPTGRTRVALTPHMTKSPQSYHTKTETLVNGVMKLNISMTRVAGSSSS